MVGEEFEVRIEYPRELSAFTYRVAFGEKEFIIPPADQPKAAADPCARTDYSLTLTSISTTGVRQTLGGGGGDGEC